VECGDAPPPEVKLDAVATACRERGWPSIASGAEEERVTLDTAGAGFRQAILTTDGATVRFFVNLRDELPEALDPASRQAIAWLLLRTGSAVRLARPCASAGDEELGFEVRLPCSARDVDFDHALSSLSLAARVSADETLALAAAPELASAYLARSPEPFPLRPPRMKGRKSWATERCPS
jgi:hypothetical protein